MLILAPNHGFEPNLSVPTQSPKIRILLDKAVDFMKNTKDPSHGLDHIHHLVQDTNRFLKSVGDTFELDKEVLLLALYWHDVWKSQNRPASINFLFHQLYEGLGSMLMFKKQAREVGLPAGTIRAVSYAIRKHSAIQFHSARTLEAQLLWDMDTLDVWNARRIQAIFRDLQWTRLSLFDSYMRYMKRAGFHLNFEWTRNEVKKMKPLFFEEMSKFRESLVVGTKTA